MFLFYTQSSRDDYESLDLRGAGFPCKEAIASTISDHQELCDGEVDYNYYALDAKKFELWRFSDGEVSVTNDDLYVTDGEWVKVKLPITLFSSLSIDYEVA